MRILLANHTGAWSGAEVSLMRLVAGLRDEHELAIACPDEGRLAREVDAAGIERLSMPAVTASLKLHPIHTPAGLRQLGVGRRRAGARREALPGGRGPREHTARGNHGRGRTARGGPAVRGARPRAPAAEPGGAHDPGADRAHGGGVAAVSDFTASRFNEGLPGPVADRVYNSIDQARFDRTRPPGPVREELGLDPGHPPDRPHRADHPWKRRTFDPRAGRAARTRARRAPAAGRAGRVRREARPPRQPRLPRLARGARRRALRAPRGPLPRPARRRPRDHAGARPVAASIVAGAVRAGYRGEHGARDAPARVRRRRGP